LHCIIMFKTVQVFLVATFRTILLTATLAIGVFVYGELENTTLFKSGHFIWTLITTVGYGEIYPKSDKGKIFTICYGLVSIPLFIFTISSYGTVLSHGLNKIISSIEWCLCKRKQIINLHIKLFVILITMTLAEIFAWGYAVSLLQDIRVLDGIYVWFVTMATVGFGDMRLANTTEDNYLNFALHIMMHVVTLSTIASLIQAIQGMLQSIDNNKRGICAKLCCCYHNERKDIYDFQMTNQEYGLHYVKE